MEDILASIRRIIADDQLQAGRSALNLRRGTQPSAPEPAEPGEPRADLGPVSQNEVSYEEVLDLAKMPNVAVADDYETVHAASAEPPYRQTEEPRYAEQESVIEPAPLPPPQAYEPPTYRPANIADPEPAPVATRPYSADLLPASAPVDTQPPHESRDSLISPKLGNSVMSAFETLAATVVLQNTEMLDRVLHDLMRPLLKTWLDENLPTLVERLVRTEIERVARGGRG